MKKMNELMSVKGSVVEAYNGESRDWWSHVNDDDIYAALGDPDFIAYVGDIYQDAVYGYPTVSAS